MSTERASPLPLNGKTVVEFSHTVLGPSCGMVLADLGANVIKVEPWPDGDPTRKLRGFGAGYFGYFNRNKRSVALDLKTPDGLEAARSIIKSADILVENFGPTTMNRLGLGYGDLSKDNPRLIYARLKGFQPGPYENRLALDEVVQMMSGLAYMTGPSGRPLRAGTSIVDIGAALFAVIGILSATMEREKTGQGQLVEASLFETTVFLMGQHLCCASQSDQPVPPMPERVSAWAVYDIFRLTDGKQFFLGLTSDRHWHRFMTQVDRIDLRDDPKLATNNLRISARSTILPELQNILGHLTVETATRLCEQAQVPFAPVARPEDLFDDPHLKATGGLLTTTLPNGIETRLPSTPIVIGDRSLPLRLNPPHVGEHTEEVLREVGVDDFLIETLKKLGTAAPTG